MDSQDAQADQRGSPPFDREAAIGRLGGDFQLLRELAEIFLVECPRMLENLQQAVAQRDPQAVKAAAHRLDGSASSFFATDVREAAQKLEVMGGEGQLDGLESAHATLEAEMRKLCSALQEFVADSEG